MFGILFAKRGIIPNYSILILIKIDSFSAYVMAGEKNLYVLC